MVCRGSADAVDHKKQSFWKTNCIFKTCLVEVVASCGRGREQCQQFYQWGSLVGQNPATKDFEDTYLGVFNVLFLYHR